MKTEQKNYIKWIIVVILIFSILVGNFCILYIHIRDDAITARKQEVMGSAIEFSNFLVESIDAVKLTAQNIEEMNRTGSTSEDILSYLEKNSTIYEKTINRSFTGFYGYINNEYLDGIGWVPDADYDPTERPWYIEAVEAAGDIAFVSPYIDSQTGSVAMSVSKLLSNQKDVISIDMSLDVLQQILEESTIRNGWRYGMILNDNNYVVAHSEIGEIGKNYNDENIGVGHDIIKKLSKDDKLVTLKIEGKRYIILTSDVGDNWKLVSVIDSSEVMGSTRKILTLLVLSLIIILAAAVKIILNIWKRQQKESYMYEQLGTLAKIYDLMFLIDIENDLFYEIIEYQSDMGIFIDNENKRAQYNIRILMDAITDRRYKKSIYDFIDLSTLSERLSDSYVISKMFINNDNQKYGVRFAPVEKNENGKVNKVIFMVESMYDD